MKHVQIAHQMPGRVRFKIPTAQDNPELLEQIRQGFADMPGLKQIRVKPDAGSIVLIYDPNQAAAFEAQLMRHWAGVMPSINVIDLKIVLALTLAIATFAGVGVSAATPMWVTLALFAVNHFIEMQTQSTAPAPKRAATFAAV